MKSTTDERGVDDSDGKACVIVGAELEVVDKEDSTIEPVVVCGETVLLSGQKVEE